MGGILDLPFNNKRDDITGGNRNTTLSIVWDVVVSGGDYFLKFFLIYRLLL